VEFDWDDANIRHVARHRVKPDEAEEVFENSPMLVSVQERSGEDRLLCFGRTNSGRFLTLVYTERNDRIRVVTVYRMTRAQQRMYLTGDADA
jgi:uncharacterized DUF497 family protein